MDNRNQLAASDVSCQSRSQLRLEFTRLHDDELESFQGAGVVHGTDVARRGGCSSRGEWFGDTYDQGIDW